MSQIDFKDVMLEAVADVQGIMREVVRDLQMPVVEKKVLEMWTNLPDEMKEQFKKDNPEAYRALMQSMQ